MITDNFGATSKAKTMAEYLDEVRAKKIANWKELTPSQKHFVAMYILRLRTDFENIECYIETAEFRKLGVSPDAFPDYLRTISPEDLRYEAYSAIGATHLLTETV